MFWYYREVVMQPRNLEKEVPFKNHGLKRYMSREALPKLDNYNSDQSITHKKLGRPTLEQLYQKESVPYLEVYKLNLQKFNL